MIEAKNISFSYDDRVILDDISLKIKEGEITTLIGPSGAGKTTLLKALTLLEKPSSGNIAIDGDNYEFPIEAEEFEKLKMPYPKMTVSFQQQFLWPHLTLEENIKLPYQNIEKTKDGWSFEELVEFFNMESFINRYPNEASLGQRQRVALARALICNPKYLFLDEITTFLDVKQISKILDSVKQLKERGISIFIITHLIEFAKDTADQVLFFDKGKIIEKGSAKILTKPETEELETFLSFAKKAL